MSLSTSLYWRAVEDEADTWVPACGGTEEPFNYFGVRWLYVFNPATQQHGYMNLDTDAVHTDYRKREWIT